MAYFPADGSERAADITIQPIKDDSGTVLFLAWSVWTSPTASEPRPIGEVRHARREQHRFHRDVRPDGVPFVNRAGLELVGLDNIDEARRTSLPSFFFLKTETESSTVLPSVLERGHGEVEVRFRHSRQARRWMA